MTQQTVGIDVAAQARATGTCAIAWEPRGAKITEVEAGVGDDRLLHLLSSEELNASG